jgi:hypothetical protein
MALFKGNPLKYEGRGLIHNIDGCFVYNIKPCTSTRFLDKALHRNKRYVILSIDGVDTKYCQCLEVSHKDRLKIIFPLLFVYVGVYPDLSKWYLFGI